MWGADVKDMGFTGSEEMLVELGVIARSTASLFKVV